MRPDNLVFHSPKYEEWIREKPCLVCGRKAQVHHVWNSGGKKAHNSMVSVSLCERHHLHGFPDSYHSLGKEEFEDRHCLNLEWEIINFLSQYIFEKNKKEN